MSTFGDALRELLDDAHDHERMAEAFAAACVQVDGRKMTDVTAAQTMVDQFNRANEAIVKDQAALQDRCLRYETHAAALLGDGVITLEQHMGYAAILSGVRAALRPFVAKRA